MPVTEYIEVGADHTITLSKAPVADSIQINGMIKGTEAGKEDTVTGLLTFAVEDKKITLGETVTGTVEVYYEIETEGARSILVDNMSSATGEAICKWPIYAAGDSCEKNSIKGYVILHVFKARITAMPG